MKKWTILFTPAESFTIAGLMIASIFLGLSLGVMSVGHSQTPSEFCVGGQLSFSGTMTDSRYIVEVAKWEEGFEKIRVEIGFHDVNSSLGNTPVIIAQNTFYDGEYKRVTTQLTAIGSNVSAEFYPVKGSESIDFFVMGLAYYYGISDYPVDYGYVIDLWSYNTC